MLVKIQSKSGEKIIDLNRRRAIRERCLNCSSWSVGEVSNCEFTTCVLYDFRSGQGKQNAKRRSRAIREYCLWCVVGSISEVSNCPSPDCSLFAYRNSALDKSTEIKSSSKLNHIEAVSGNKMRNEYQGANII